MEKVKAFLEVINSMVTKKNPSKEAIDVVNSMNTSTDISGGALVPKEMLEDINIIKRGSKALENYVTVIPVSGKDGKTIIGTEYIAAMEPVEEEAPYPVMAGADLEFKEVLFTIKKYGCISVLSREVLKDAGEKLEALLKTYCAKKSIATRNKQILECIENNFNTVKSQVTTKDEIINISVSVPVGLMDGIKVITNQNGFMWLKKHSVNGDLVELVNGEHCLLGLYPIIIMDNDDMPSNDSTHPLLLGNLAEGIVLTDREAMTVNLSEHYSTTAWLADLVGMKIADRFDVIAIDNQSIIKCELKAI